jgi:hypothetical protein
MFGQVVTTPVLYMGSKDIKIDYVSAQAMLQDFAHLSVNKGGMKPAYNVHLSTIYRVFKNVHNSCK